MATFEAIILLLLGSVAVTALARRLNAPFPVFLALAGAGLALAPLDTPFRLDPKLALALFVAPVLLDAAYDTSVRDLRANWRPVGLLVLVAVGLTTAAVATVARWLEPALPWSAAVALGAIVAPPDAAAATTVLRQVGLPHRLKVVLEGESLLNDASALLIYKLAVAATLAGGVFDVRSVAPTFALAVVGGVALGVALAYAWLWLTRGLRDVPSAIILQFVGTFGVWIVADRLQTSAILAMVAYGVTVARYAPERSPARMRVPSYAVWETVVLVLNVMAFVTIGLQLRPILAAAPQELVGWSVFAGAVLAAVILVRIGWVVSYGALVRLKNRHVGVDLPETMARPTWQGSVVISWSGMRGIITLATALALPQNFPRRGLLLFTAFAVTLGTLVIQGLTLRPLLLALDLHDDAPVDREVREARVKLARAGLETLEGETSPAAETFRKKLRAEAEHADAATEGDGRPELESHRLQRRVLDRRRAALLALRRDRNIGDDAFHRLEEELDMADLGSPIDPA